MAHDRPGVVEGPPPAPPPLGYRPTVLAAALAWGLASTALLLPPSVEWLGSWRGLLDLFVSLWSVSFLALILMFWAASALRHLVWPRSRSRPGGEVASGGPEPPLPVGEDSCILPSSTGDALHLTRKRAWGWALLLLAVCTLELLTHAGERNGFLASSRPTGGVETWTTADGYAVLLDGIPAQGDGLFLLPMLNLFLDAAPPAASEFDRRAGHVYLVSLLSPSLGTFWSFAAVNLVAWWGAALAVWYLGHRRWPGTAVPWIASLLVATGQGFLFMGTAPQAHATAYAAFALFLVLCDALRLWAPAARPRDWLSAGWGAGAAGLIYLVHLPCLLFLWLYASAGLTPRRIAGLLLATITAVCIVASWQLYGAGLGLGFSGGNNDLAGQALAGWMRVARAGHYEVIGQLRAGSIRGLAVAAFYYPLWILAAVGLLASGRDARRWALAVLIAGALPAIAFSTRFHLPRLTYFMYPAVYLLAAAGTAALADLLSRFLRPRFLRGRRHGESGAGSRRVAYAVMATLTLGLVALTNLDLWGVQQFNLWFHYSQGNAW